MGTGPPGVKVMKAKADEVGKRKAQAARKPMEKRQRTNTAGNTDCNRVATSEAEIHTIRSI